MPRLRVVRAWWGTLALIAGLWGCETARNPGGVQRDVIPPTITLSATADTQQIASGLAFTVNATDNLSLKDIQLTYSGGYIAQTDTVFTSATPSVTIGEHISFPASSGAGGLIKVVGRATDGGGNFAIDSIFIFLSNVQALKVNLLAPAVGALASTGKNLTVAVQAQQLGGIQRVGFIIVPRSAVTDPTTPPTDSLVFVNTFPPDTTYTDTLTVAATTGTFTVTGFAVDAGGRRGLSNTITVTVQSAANDVTPPVVSHTIAARVQVSDSITVHATDPSGISLIGFQVDTSLTLTGPALSLVTLDVSAANLTDVTRAFSLGLAALINQFPKSVIVRGYACDLATPTHNCGYSTTSTVITAPPRRSGPARAANPSGGTDTVIVVAGFTRPLPLGGSIADAIYDSTRRELYLTNPALSRVEVFQVANSTFVASGIPSAGAQPWGIALWPKDTLGHYADTIVVANSGGTQLSVINVGPGAPRQLLWRQDLPDFLVETYHVLTQAGGFQLQIVVYNISDRPQYVATVCRVGAAPPNCDADSIFAMYSTTPTAADPSPFTNRATLRMEKLHRPAFNGDTTGLFGHFFWELAEGAPATGNDTLRIELRRGLPYNQTKVILSACAGVNVNLSRFGLGDSTFARNSGNFTHGFFGEGGALAGGIGFARVMAYTTKAPLIHGSATTTTCATPTSPPGPNTGITDTGDNDVDLGMSPAVDVTDFITNTATRVRSIATNFNGATNVARADSLYFLDEGLRLKATSPDSSGPWMDMNVDHNFAAGGSCNPTCGGTGNINNRILFAAGGNPTIHVWDTFYGALVDSIPVRDPIIGPLRVAKDAGGQQLLFGITARGLVIVRLPAITNTFTPAPPRR
ncbi:MAG TPA: hypothetical protein VGV12_01470 [Gemmatimonadales bacterium]|nr:hypothetical protein [Gemmatimonadales bacterium]